MCTDCLATWHVQYMLYVMPVYDYKTPLIFDSVHINNYTYTNIPVHVSMLLYTHTHTHTFLWLQAIELDPENESYRANLKTVEEQLQGGGATSTAAGGGMGGATTSGGGGEGTSQQQQPGGGGGNPLGGERCHSSLPLHITTFNASLFHRYAREQLCQYPSESSIHEHGEEN